MQEEDFLSYSQSFLALNEHKNQIFTLPINFIDHPIVNDISKTDCPFIILTGLPSLFSNQRKLVEHLVTLRSKISTDVAIYSPGPVPPAFYPFLVYSGIDFFDDSFAYYISDRGYFLSEDNTYPISSHPNCYCSYCQSSPPDIINHNITVMKNALAKIRYHIKQGTFRTMVEKEIHNSISFAAALRYYDRQYDSIIRKRVPLQTSAKVKCIGEESLYRPEIVEYRERIKSRYIPPRNSKIVLLLPCSAKKPYSMSQSHNLFREAIRKADRNIFQYISELIITSPLSVVPRELESIYPSKFYDITVTGTWSSEEVNVTSSLLNNVLSKYQQDVIVIDHTHGQGYREIVKKINTLNIKEIYHTSPERHPTSRESLTKLTETLKDVLNSINNQTNAQSYSILQRKLIATANHQFGPLTGEEIFNGEIKTRGKYPRDIQIFKNKTLIATYLSRTGFLSLQPETAQKIVNHSLVNLEFNDSKIEGSTIYAPGCKEPSVDIRPLDEIFIVNSGSVLATAKALVSGEDMQKMSSGAIAEIKKKVRK